MGFNQGVVNTVWLVFDMMGQWSLVALLATFSLLKNIPQRHNPFLINVLITTLLASIPPSFLYATFVSLPSFYLCSACRVYSGHESRKSPPSDRLCAIQASLVDGMAPMCEKRYSELIFPRFDVYSIV